MGANKGSIERTRTFKVEVEGESIGEHGSRATGHFVAHHGVHVVSPSVMSFGSRRSYEHTCLCASNIYWVVSCEFEDEDVDHTRKANEGGLK